VGVVVFFLEFDGREIILFLLEAEEKKHIKQT
jgi:hypothetical protein